MDTLLHRLCFQPSFAEKAQGKRVGFKNEGSEPRETSSERGNRSRPCRDDGKQRRGDAPGWKQSIAPRSEGVSLDGALAAKIRAIKTREVVE